MDSNIGRSNIVVKENELKNQKKTKKIGGLTLELINPIILCSSLSRETAENLSSQNDTNYVRTFIIT